jgi:hypothetical protein
MQNLIVALIYWALFAFAVIGVVGSILSVLNGRWGWLMVSVAAIVPYAGVWLLDYGNNRLIRQEIAVSVELVGVQIDKLADGRKVTMRLTPQPRTFCDAPTAFEFSNFGAVDNRPVAVVASSYERGIDGLISAVTVQLFVPNLGASSVRLNAITFGNRRYLAKSPVVPFETHYASD